MNEYTGFAAVYDLFMDNVPYDQWAENIVKALKSHNINDGLVLDLGCGTGTLTEKLAESGYDMIGVDGSEDMLMLAMDKKDVSGHDILYLNQDLIQFELYGTVRAVICACDTLNYIIEPDDLLKVLKLVNNYLDDDGIFIFDMNTVSKYENVLADNVFAENRDNASFIWENSFDRTLGMNEFMLTLYIDDGNGRYDRYEEVHYQRAYDNKEIDELLKNAGFNILNYEISDDRMFYTVGKRK